MTLPKEIKTSRTFVYDVPSIVQSLVDMDADLNHEDVTLDMVLDLVVEWAYEDMRSPIEDEPRLFDENGNELN
jgi:hypothetical protein